MDSLKEAEKLVGKKLVIPPKPAPIKVMEAVPYHFDADADEDVVSTLANANYAEKEIFDNNRAFVSGKSYFNKQTGEKVDHGDGFVVSSKKGVKVGGTKYTVSGGDYSKKKNEHDHHIDGYGWSKDGAEHRDWWNYLVKDKFDGMAATTVNTNDWNTADPRNKGKDYMTISK